MDDDEDSPFPLLQGWERGSQSLEFCLQLQEEEESSEGAPHRGRAVADARAARSTRMETGTTTVCRLRPHLHVNTDLLRRLAPRCRYPRLVTAPLAVAISFDDLKRHMLVLVAGLDTACALRGRSGRSTRPARWPTSLDSNSHPLRARARIHTDRRKSESRAYHGKGDQDDGDLTVFATYAPFFFGSFRFTGSVETGYVLLLHLPRSVYTAGHWEEREREGSEEGVRRSPLRRGAGSGDGNGDALEDVHERSEGGIRALSVFLLVVVVVPISILSWTSLLVFLNALVAPLHARSLESPHDETEDVLHRVVVLNSPLRPVQRDGDCELTLERWSYASSGFTARSMASLPPSLAGSAHH
ncbi:hypothetical protein K438DRAFT_1952418 [Mycena galopus ATCC 62051]|nr:hypothetical protein K438DRAFT_1952418 [Mycena galopus ATCC 62051]